MIPVFRDRPLYVIRKCPNDSDHPIYMYLYQTLGEKHTLGALLSSIFPANFRWLTTYENVLTKEIFLNTASVVKTLYNRKLINLSCSTGLKL